LLKYSGKCQFTFGLLDVKNCENDQRFTKLSSDITSNCPQHRFFLLAYLQIPFKYFLIYFADSHTGNRNVGLSPLAEAKNVILFFIPRTFDTVGL